MSVSSHATVTPEIRLQAKTLDPVVIGTRLREARQRAGLTQTEASGDAMSTAYISRIEAGQRRASPDLLVQLAARLGCELDALLAPADEVVDADVVARLTLELDFVEISLRTGDHAGARDQVMRVLEDPELPDEVERKARFLHGLTLEARGDYDGAVTAIEKVVRSGAGEVSLVEVMIALSRCYREQGDLARACEVGERAERLLDQEELRGTAAGVQLAVTVAAAHFERGDVHHALRLCSRAVEDAEELESPMARASAYWNKANVYSLQGDVRSALPLAQKAVSLLEQADDARNMARLRIQLGHLQLETDPPQVVAAVQNFERAESELPFTDVNQADRGRARLGLAKARLLEGADLEAERLAEDCYLEAGQSSPLIRAEARTIVGRVQSERGRVDDAVSEFRRAILELSGVGADRQAAQLWFELGNHLHEHGAIEDAADAFRRAATSTGLTSHVARRRTRQASPVMTARSGQQRGAWSVKR